MTMSTPLSAASDPGRNDDKSDADGEERHHRCEATAACPALH